MTPGTPLALPMTGISTGGDDGKVNLLYDESLNRYYLAGRRMYGESSTDYEAFSYNNVPFTKTAIYWL
ncbi:hypothetical protein EJ377_02915 [Chryseobacterium arthrosphaerae]|uniref:Uncharacterized protein n=1 Tax=Chryseobacterium arthrosphaerae TaxID=651561 RepID=A0A432DZ77_9FLAO|nr:hypothetical protein EJ377_02915 [Chryseobacterium arthrosphaerae]